MNDHELDDQMRHLAHSYNEPPATPGDAMWARIEQARADRRPVAIGAGRRMHWLRMGAGIAAVLVVGIGIGRLSRGVRTVAAPAPVSSVEQGVPMDTVGHDAIGGAAIVRAGSTDAPTAESSYASTAGEKVVTNPVRATRGQRISALGAERATARRGLAAYGVPRVQGAVGDGSDMSAYRLAVVEHMARTEVLLTSFLADSRSSPADGRAAAQFAALSRDLLKTTRLLLATRSTDDPALTRLLEDLELVLMQISQYSSEGRRGDLDAINQSIDRRNVLPKLRSAIPAGASASTGI